jgi:hypothetical protein
MGLSYKGKQQSESIMDRFTGPGELFDLSMCQVDERDVMNQQAGEWKGEYIYLLEECLAGSGSRAALIVQGESLQDRHKYQLATYISFLTQGR